MAVHDATLQTLDLLSEYGISSRELISGPFAVSNIANVAGDTWRITLPASADLSSVVAGHVVQISFGDNAGHHVVTAVDNAGPRTIDFEDPTGVAQGAIGEASIYRIPLTQLDRIVVYEVIPWAERVSRTSFSGEKVVVEYHDGTGTPELVLDRRTINELVSIETLDIPQDILFIRASDVEVVDGWGLLRVRSSAIESYGSIAASFPRGENNIKVTYKTGYSVLPPDIAQAVSLMAGNLYLGEEGGFDGGGGSLSVEGYSKGFGDQGAFTEVRNQMATRARSILSQYRTGVVGN